MLSRIFKSLIFFFFNLLIDYYYLYNMCQFFNIYKKKNKKCIQKYIKTRITRSDINII